jgi:hypothetical protein
MDTTVLFKVQYPPGSLKKTTTVNLKGDLTVEGALAEIIKAGRLTTSSNKSSSSNDDNSYLLYLQHQHSHNDSNSPSWLPKHKLLSELGLTAQVCPWASVEFGGQFSLLCRFIIPLSLCSINSLHMFPYLSLSIEY